jgi:hypothetical protein
MTDVRLTDDNGTKIRDCLRQDPHASVGTDEDACRRFVDAVKWMSRSGAQMSRSGAQMSRNGACCPPSMGHATAPTNDSCVGVRQASARRRRSPPSLAAVARRSRPGTRQAHPCAAGAPKKHGAQALGRSRGGFSGKIHLTVDGLGNPLRLRLRLTAGQRHDSTPAQALLDGLPFERVIADRGEAAADFVA